MGNAHLCSSKANQFESLQEGKANDPTGPLEIVYDGRFIALAPGSAAYKKHKEMVFDVSMWKYQIGNHLVLVKGSLFGKTRMRGGGRDFVIHEDGTISPKPAQHLVLGARYDGALALFPKGAPEAVMLAAVNPKGNPMARLPKAAAYGPGPLCSTSLVLSSHAGKAIVPRWNQTRNAWGQWDYIDLGVGPAKENDPTGTLKVLYDGQFIALAPGSAAYAMHQEMVFDVSMWNYQIGNHLVLVKVDPRHAKKDCTRKRGGGRDFMIHEDGTISPKHAPHLVLGCRHDGALALFSKGAPEVVVLAAVNPSGKAVASVSAAAEYGPGPLCPTRGTSLVLSSHAGKAIVPRWKQTRNAWGQWDYINLGVGPARDNDPTGTLKVVYDGQFIALAPGSAAHAMHQEMVFDVSMWQYKVGNHLVLVKVDPRHATKDSTRKHGGGRDFIIHEDGTISPKPAQHLVLGCRRDGALTLFHKGAREAVVLAAVNPSGKAAAAQGLGTTENDEEKMYQSPKQIAHPPSRSFRARTSKNRVLFSVLASPTQNSENAIGSVTHSLGPNRLGRTSLMLACPHAGKAIVPRWKETRSFNEWNYIELDVGPANDNDPSCKPKRSTCEEVGETEGERYRGEEEEGMPTKITKM